MQLASAGGADLEVPFDLSDFLGRCFVVEVRDQRLVHVAAGCLLFVAHFITIHWYFFPLNYIASLRCPSRFLSSDNPVYIRVLTVDIGIPRTSAISENFRPSYSFITITCRISDGKP